MSSYIHWTKIDGLTQEKDNLFIANAMIIKCGPQKQILMGQFGKDSCWVLPGGRPTRPDQTAKNLMETNLKYALGIEIHPSQVIERKTLIRICRFVKGGISQKVPCAIYIIMVKDLSFDLPEKSPLKNAEFVPFEEMVNTANLVFRPGQVTPFGKFREKHIVASSALSIAFADHFMSSKYPMNWEEKSVSPPPEEFEYLIKFGEVWIPLNREASTIITNLMTESSGEATIEVHDTPIHFIKPKKDWVPENGAFVNHYGHRFHRSKPGIVYFGTGGDYMPVWPRKM